MSVNRPHPFAIFPKRSPVSLFKAMHRLPRKQAVGQATCRPCQYAADLGPACFPSSLKDDRGEGSHQQPIPQYAGSARTSDGPESPVLPPASCRWKQTPCRKDEATECSGLEPLHGGSPSFPCLGWPSHTRALHLGQQATGKPPGATERGQISRLTLASQKNSWVFKMDTTVFLLKVHPVPQSERSPVMFLPTGHVQSF